MMLYYGRKPVTRMSFYHLRKTLDLFNSLGVDAEAVVIGDEPDQQELAEALGFKHVWVENKPLNKKMMAGFQAAVDQGRDYVCWLGSNNVHDPEYFKDCIDMLGSRYSYFGGDNFLVIGDNREDTYRFRTKGIHLCSSGQFYKTEALSGSINFDDKMSQNFDGKINKAIYVKDKKNCVFKVSGTGYNCVDVKTGGDLHAFSKYAKTPYISDTTRQSVLDKFEEVQMLFDGEFSEENYRTSVLATYLSESEHI